MVSIGVQVVAIVLLLVAFLYAAGGARTKPWLLLLLGFLLFAFFFATDLGQTMLGWLEGLLDAMSEGEVVDPEPT